MSDQLREIGNKAFQDGQYAEAINAYTGAIELNPECDTSYCNRSLVYHKLGQFDEALRDAKVNPFVYLLISFLIAIH